MSERVGALVHYYAREGLHRQVVTVCSEFLKKRPNDTALVFYRAALGLLPEGNNAEAMRDLKAVAQVPDVELAASAAMITCHEAAKVQDTEAIMELQDKIDVEEGSATDTAALLLASYLMYTSSKERARGMAERVLLSTPDSMRAQVLLGWIILQQQQDDEMDAGEDESDIDEALSHFDAVLESDSDHIEAMMGRAKALELKKDLAGALEVVTEVHVRFTWYMPALVEKTRLLLASNDWEGMLEHAGRMLQADPNNVMAMAYTALYSLVRDGNSKAATKTLQDVYNTINTTEPKNAALYVRVSRPFARLAGADPALLTVTGMMAERAVQLRPDHAPFLVEAGYNRLFLQEYEAAEKKFSAALQIDELSIDATCGSLECSLLAGNIDESANQIMFLEEMFNSQASLTIGRKLPHHLSAPAADMEPPLLTYLKGLQAWKLDDVSNGLSLMERAMAGHFELAAQLLPSFDTYLSLSPTRMVGAVRLMLATVGGEPRAPTEAPSPILGKCSRALELLVKWVPGMLDAQLLSARALYLNGSLDAAQRKAADVLRTNPEAYMVHLLICSIYVHQDKPQLAMAALDQAVSANFAVRETPLYHIVNAKVLIASNKLEDARKVLEAAINLPGVRTALKPEQRARLGPRVQPPTLHERASIYLLLADVLGRLSKLPDAPEAKKYISDAIREFEGTSEEVRVTVADSELAIARGDVEGALKKLRKIPDLSPHYTKARMAMADIFLNHRKDKASYVRCYLDLVDQAADYDTYCMLGEAFMQIQEPEKAVRAFELALEYQPKDSELIRRIARALVTTHDYSRAIDFYNKAIYIARSNWSLLLELATLLVRLQQWQPAVATLNKCLERQKDNPYSVENLELDVDAWLIMSKVYKGSGDSDSYSQGLQRALDLQKQQLSNMRGELPEALSAQRAKAAGICHDLAEHYDKTMREREKAVELYNDALRQSDAHAPSLLALARLHLAAGDMDKCQTWCVDLLKHDPENEEASVMLAELMFHKENYDSAIFHFHQLMERSPTHYVALVNLIQLLRRAGRLNDVPRYFSMAEQHSPKAIMDPGFHFCKGMYSRYTNHPREALKEFNLARKDTKWGGESILQMVEIYLNPDNDAIWEEKENADTPESREAVMTARSLLAQMRLSDTHSTRYRVLEAYAMMAGRNGAEVEAALGKLLDMANADPNSVPVLLAMASGECANCTLAASLCV